MSFRRKLRLPVLLEATERVVGTAGLMLILVLVGWTMIDIAWRLAGQGSIGGAVEVSELIIVIMVFFGISFVQAQGKHIDVPLLVQSFPPRAQKVLKVMALLMGLFFFMMIAIQCSGKFLEAWHGKWLMGFGEYPIPQWPGFFAIVLGSALFCIRLFADLLKTVLSLPESVKRTMEGTSLEEEALQRLSSDPSGGGQATSEEGGSQDA